MKFHPSRPSQSRVPWRPRRKSCTPTAPRNRSGIRLPDAARRTLGSVVRSSSPAPATSASGGHGLRASLGERRVKAAALVVLVGGLCVAGPWVPILVALLLCAAHGRSHQAAAGLEPGLRPLPGLPGRVPDGRNGAERIQPKRTRRQSQVWLPSQTLGCLGYCCGLACFSLVLRGRGSGIKDVSFAPRLCDPPWVQYLKLGASGVLPVKSTLPVLLLN